MAVQILDPSSVPLKRRADGNIWTTLTQVLVVVIALLVMAGMLLLFIPVIQIKHKLQMDNVDLNHKTEAALDYQDQLKLKRDLIKNDPAYLEFVSRQVLNLGKTNEVIFKFDPLQPEPATPDQDRK